MLTDYRKVHKIVNDGYVWDSKKEMYYYYELKLFKKAGKIIDFKIKPIEILIDSFEIYDGGKKKKIRAITYEPDFLVFHDGFTEFVDVKGFKTAIFNLKWKMLKYKYRNEKNYKFTLI